MATKKTETENRARSNSATTAYNAAVEQYASAVKLMSSGDFAQAKEALAKVPEMVSGEPELIERARTYTKICDGRMSGPVIDPTTLDERYRSAVVHMNEGHYDEAIQLLNQALAEDPTSVNCLYVRASALALQGSASKAVADLREAIAIDPKVRFQAVNDSDFEKIREEPSFIDIIEPTPTGA